MGTTRRRRTGVIARLVALAMTTCCGLTTTPAGAATTNPCKVLKKAEIQRAFGGTVGRGRRGLSTPVSEQCEYSVSADGERPDGTVIVKVMTSGAEAAYDALKKTSSYAPIDGVPHSLWGNKVHVVELLQGNVLLGMQGGFLVSDPLPLHFSDDQAQLIALAQIGSTRV